jgi:hypothetical protein
MPIGHVPAGTKFVKMPKGHACWQIIAHTIIKTIRWFSSATPEDKRKADYMTNYGIIIGSVLNSLHR